MENDIIPKILKNNNHDDLKNKRNARRRIKYELNKRNIILREISIQ